METEKNLFAKPISDSIKRTQQMEPKSLWRKGFCEKDEFLA